MTVVYRKDAEARYTIEEVMWAREDLLKAIVRHALIGQTEAFVDMTVDCQSDMDKEQLTRDGLQAGLGGVMEATADFLEDMLTDLKFEVLRKLKEANYGAVVTGIKYDLAGEISDIEVDISVS